MATRIYEPFAKDFAQLKEGIEAYSRWSVRLYRSTEPDARGPYMIALSWYVTSGDLEGETVRWISPLHPYFPCPDLAVGTARLLAAAEFGLADFLESREPSEQTEAA